MPPFNVSLRLSSHHQSILIFLFFIFFLFLGLTIYKDYGTFGDEALNSQNIGERGYQYIKHFNILKPTPYPIDYAYHPDVIHGMAFEIFLDIYETFYVYPPPGIFCS